jgi:hypothetical protein
MSAPAATAKATPAPDGLAAAAWSAAMPMGCVAAARTSAPARMSSAAAWGWSKNNASCTGENPSADGSSTWAPPASRAPTCRTSPAAAASARLSGRSARIASTTRPCPR